MILREVKDFYEYLELMKEEIINRSLQENKTILLETPYVIKDAYYLAICYMKNLKISFELMIYISMSWIQITLRFPTKEKSLCQDVKESFIKFKENSNESKQKFLSLFQKPSSSQVEQYNKSELDCRKDFPQYRKNQNGCLKDRRI